MRFKGFHPASLFFVATLLSQPVAAASGIDFSLALGGQISGTVTDADSGLPIASRVVYALDATTSELISSDVTDANGDYSLTVDTGSFLVFAAGGASFTGSAYAGEFYPNAYIASGATPVAAVRGQTVDGIDLALGPGGSISGTVRGDYGGATGLLPLAFSIVYAIREGQSTDDTWSDALAVEFTDFSGNFSIDGLAPGNYHVFARGQDDFAGEYYADAYSADAANTVAVSDGSTTNGINFDLVEGGEITGRVASEVTDQGLGGVSVSLVRPGVDDVFSLLVPQITVTSTNGEYRLGGLWPGTYYVQVDFRRSAHTQYASELFPGVYRQSTATPQNVALGQSIGAVDFDAAVGGVIEGRVLRADNGLPMDQIDVIAVPVDITQSTWWYDFFGAVGANQTGDDGRYRLTGLPPGDFKVIALPEPFFDPQFSISPPMNQYFAGQYYSGAYTATAADDLGVTLGGTLDGIDFNLAIGGVVSGTVTDEADSQSIEGITVFTQPDLPSLDIDSLDEATIDYLDYLLGFREAQSGADGTYQIIGLPPVNTIVQAYDFEPGIYLFEIYDDTMEYLAATPVPVTSPGVETASINGVVGSDDGTPLSGLEVKVFDNDSGALRGTATTAANGGFTIGGLFPGAYQVEVIGTDDYAGEYYGDTMNPDSAQLVTVDFGMNAVGIDFALASAMSPAAVAAFNALILQLLEE